MEIVTEGNDMNEESGETLGFSQKETKVREGAAFNPNRIQTSFSSLSSVRNLSDVGFLKKGTKARKEQAKLKFPFSPPAFFPEGDEGNEGRSGLQQNTIFVLFVVFCKSSPMHPLYEKADKLSSGVIGAAIGVHRHKGPGLIESNATKSGFRDRRFLQKAT